MEHEPPEVTVTESAGRAGISVELQEWSVAVIGGPDKGRKLKTLEPLVGVGTDSTNDLALSDPTVSRRHLEIERTPRGFLLRDLGSRNGTYVDGRLTVSTYLVPGDKLTLGKTKLQVKQESRPTTVELDGLDAFGELVGASDKMRVVFSELRRFALDDINLLLEGETGTGKELAARAVHGHSARRDGPFHVVDCSLLSPESADRELFGGLRAADEGGESGRRASDAMGAFGAAAGGTLFFDEIAELPLALQPKLLRVLETGELSPPGVERPVAVDVRIIASTHHNLEEEVRRGNFRADLFYRLAVARVRLPPLRARREDIPLLARHLLRVHAIPFELTEQTQNLFGGYAWPGNVRELRNVLERGAVMQETGSQSWLDLSAPAPSGEPQREKGRTLSSVVISLPYHEAKDRVLNDFERVYFAEVMKAASFDMKVAEQMTGLSMQSLYRLLKKNGLRLKDLKSES